MFATVTGTESARITVDGNYIGSSMTFGDGEDAIISLVNGETGEVSERNNSDKF